MIHRALTLLWWLALWVIPGGLRWRYWRGGWIREFVDCQSSVDTSPANRASRYHTTSWFEALRAIMSSDFLHADLPMPTTQHEAEALWKRPICANHLLSFIGRRELHPLRFLRLMRWLPWFGRVLEFGAGAAPLAHGVSKAWPLPAPSIDVADIDWPLRDYCEQRFAREWPKIEVLAVSSIDDRVRNKGPYDAIVALECLEHVPDPLATAKQLVQWLNEGGVLLWDYAVQEKDQPLAPKGLTGRQPTIDYLTRRLEHVHGPDARGLRVGRKRQTHVRGRA